MRKFTLAVCSCILGLTTLAMGQQGPPPVVPDNPPRASLITVSSPDPAGNVLVTGAAGSVPAASTIVLITLDTGHFAKVVAAADGSFAGSIFAAASGSILIRADPSGRYIQQFLMEPESFQDPHLLGGLPGTIMRVPEPASASSGIAFSASGPTAFSIPNKGPVYTFQGTINSATLQPGGNLRVQGTLRVLSPALQSAGPIQVTVRIALERLTGPDGTGTQAQDTLSSAIMTPTGLPIERMGPLMPPQPPLPFGQNTDYTLAKVASNRAEATVDMTLQVPATALAGYYRPYVALLFNGVPQEDPPSATFISVDRPRRRPWVFGQEGPASTSYLPIVKVGSPASPHLFFTMLTDNLSNGTRGVGAIEDRNKFGLATKILTESETYIIPRSDAAGQPITYRLEPFAPTVSISDRAYPMNPPVVPFRFPSGGLTVQVQKPDGTTDTIGPVSFVQSRMRSLVDSFGVLLDNGGGHMADVYQLSTMDSRFNYQFAQDGKHVITVTGTINDVWGNTWTGGGTYEVNVARTLSLDTAVLPMMQFEVGDVFDPGLVLSPPVPADVQVRFRMAPNSDTARMSDRTISGTANRFGYFHLSGSGISLDQPGEYRVDVTATYRDPQGALWMGSRTWGGVVASKTPSIVAHGRRGINGDDSGSVVNQWFFRTQTGVPVGGSHLPFPFQSGDVTWVSKQDASIALLSFQDPGGSISRIMTSRLGPPGESPNMPFPQSVSTGEIPLFSSRPDNADPHLDPSLVDLWAYGYRSVQRPLVRVREIISEENSGASPYWRFNEQYAGQIGVGQQGDLQNDIKFQYGGVVIRGSAIGNPQYAIYGSLFVLISDNDSRGGSRTFPPFQGNGGGPSGGPIMTLKGRDIDMFFHPTAVRPGTVLEVGDTFAVAGAVGPTLAGTVSTTITKPSGRVVTLSGKANKVGYYYRPTDDFIADEAGVYTVDLSVTFDGITSAGQVSQPFPHGGVLGTANGRFYVYVVSRGGPALNVDLPDQIQINPAALVANASAPTGMTLTGGHMTATMPGFMLQTNDLSASGGSLTYRPDFLSLSRDFPNLDLTPPADLVTMTLFGSGVDDAGKPMYAAKVIDLHGAALFNPAVGRTISFGVGDRGGTSLTSSGGSGNVTVGYGRIRPTSGSTSPSGLAIFGFRQNGVLVTEAAVPASAAVQSGRIYAEINGPVNTGLAIANPNAVTANVSFYFTDQNGQDFKAGSTTIAANSKIAAFLDQSPFNGGSSVSGTFTFSSDVPVAVVALRGLTNERGEFLITTLPVSALTPATDTLVFPHFADGGGWVSQVVLVNPTDSVLTGTVAFIPDGGTGTNSSYTIPARSSRVVKTAGQATTVQGGWVRVSPAAGSKSPSGVGIFSFRNNGVTVAEAGVGSAPPSAAVRLYAEVSGGTDQIQTGIAVANSSAAAATVNFELTTLAGVSTGLTGSIVVPANGHAATFLGQIQGFARLATPFQGVLRISSTAPSGISVTGLRGRYNERGDFLITTTPPVNESTAVSSTELLFPHLADAGGYTTQFILFSGSANQTSAGTLQFYTSDGQTLNLTLR